MFFISVCLAAIISHHQELTGKDLRKLKSDMEGQSTVLRIYAYIRTYKYYVRMLCIYRSYVYVCMLLVRYVLVYFM